jgi:SAM-dependent methyltransferase
MDSLCKISAKEIIDHLAKKKCCSFFRKFSVLDIGTGGGQFISQLPKRVKGYGITATNMRDEPPSDTYRICNAENLNEQFSPKSLDCIVSHLAFMHMVDPLKALKEAYTALKPGGFIFIDKFQLKGVDTEEWINRMQNKGYEIASLPAWRNGERSALETLIIRKSKSSLETEITYDKAPDLKEEKCRYILNYSGKAPICKSPNLTYYLDRSPTLRIRAYQLSTAEEGELLNKNDLLFLQKEEAAAAKHLLNFKIQLEMWDIPFKEITFPPLPIPIESLDL